MQRLTALQELLLPLRHLLFCLERGLVGLVLLLVRKLDAGIGGGDLLLLHPDHGLRLLAPRARLRDPRIGLALGRLGRLELALDAVLAPHRDHVDESQRLRHGLARGG